MFKSTHTSLIVSSPYVTAEGTDFVLANLSRQAKAGATFQILTDLSPLNIYQGSTDPAALASLVSELPRLHLSHLPRLHAKVYVADNEHAIITSANLTAGGLGRNYEYGVKINDRPAVEGIAQDMASYADLGATVTPGQLSDYCHIAQRLRQTYANQEKSVVESVRREFEQQLSTAEDELIRFRLAGGAMHTVFAKTILYLLNRYGPLSTVELHPRVKSIHPDLCDDTIDRVIDGKHFGKKWKHAVRTAEQQLKKKGLIFISGDRWMLSSARIL